MPTGKLERFTGILVGDDGKVLHVLHGEKFKLRDGTEVVDGAGRTMLPGLIDAHGHVMGLGFMALQLDLTGTTSLADLQARLKAYAAANPGDGWILGRGWNQENWADKKFPTAADLDAVVGGPAGVAGAGRWPCQRRQQRGDEGGGRDRGDQGAERRRDHQRPVRRQCRRPWSTQVIPAPTPAQYDAALAKAQEIMLSVGLTAAADMGTSADDWAAMNRAGRGGDAQRADHELCRRHSRR